MFKSLIPQPGMFPRVLQEQREEYFLSLFPMRSERGRAPTGEAKMLEARSTPLYEISPSRNAKCARNGAPQVRAAAVTSLLKIAQASPDLVNLIVILRVAPAEMVDFSRTSDNY